MLLVDDHPVVLRGVRDALIKQKSIEVVGEASSGVAAIRQAQKARPDIVLLDISMPSMTGVELTKRLLKLLPQTKVIGFTMHDKKEYVDELIRQGAHGYVLKNSSTDELVQAIRAVYNGAKYFSPEISRMLVEEYISQVAEGSVPTDRLTDREREILGYIAVGLSSKEIGEQLHVSARTVDTHRENMMRKLKIHTAIGLANYAHSKGIVEE